MLSITKGKQIKIQQQQQQDLITESNAAKYAGQTTTIATTTLVSSKTVIEEISDCVGERCGHFSPEKHTICTTTHTHTCKYSLLPSLNDDSDSDSDVLEVAKRQVDSVWLTRGRA